MNAPCVGRLSRVIVAVDRTCTCSRTSHLYPTDTRRLPKYGSGAAVRFAVCVVSTSNDQDVHSAFPLRTAACKVFANFSYLFLREIRPRPACRNCTVLRRVSSTYSTPSSIRRLQCLFTSDGCSSVIHPRCTSICALICPCQPLILFFEMQMCRTVFVHVTRPGLADTHDDVCLTCLTRTLNCPSCCSQ